MNRMNENSMNVEEVEKFFMRVYALSENLNKDELEKIIDLTEKCMERLTLKWWRYYHDSRLP